MPSVLTFNAENWNRQVLQSVRPVLVDFRAPWCMASVLQDKSLSEASEEFREAMKVGVLDVSSYTNEAVAYRIHVLPTLGLFDKGKHLKSYTGARRMEELKARWLPSLQKKL